MKLGSRHLWIVVGFVVVYLVLPSLRIDLSLTAIAAAFVVFLAISLLVDLLHARRRAAAREKVASDPALRRLSVFVGGYDGQVYALGASDGSIRWRAQTGAGSDDAPSSPPSSRGSALGAIVGAVAGVLATGPLAVSSTPTAADGTIYVGSRDDHLYAIETGFGSVRWRYRTGGIVLSRPAVAGDTVYVGSDDRYLYALAASDGSLRWRTPCDGPVRSGPVVLDDVVYVGSDDHRVHALAARDGTRLWSYETGRPIGSAPIIWDGVLYVGSDDHHVYALNARDGSLAWRHKTGERIPTAPAVANGIVYVASEDQFLYALDARSGKLRWRFQYGGGRSSPVVVDGIVYVGSGGLGRYQERASKPALFEQGNVWALRAGDGKLLWRYYLGTLSAAATPVIANGVVVVSASGFSSPSYTGIHAFDAKSGQLLWQSPAGIGGEYGVGVALA